jgi:glycerol-3-phosphate dehydrogenase (NAD(P)+)
MADNYSVIGAGAWGTTIAQCLAENGHNVRLWCYSNSIADGINQQRSHHRLPGVALSNKIKAVTDLSDCYQSDVVILGLSSSQLVDYDLRIDWSAISAPVAVLAKGIIEPEFFIVDWLKKRVQQSVAVISGPNLALEIAQKKPAATVIASEDQSLAQRIQTSLSNQYLRCYTTQDVRGVQCGGIFKNVFAIAAGCIDGLALGDNAKSAIITRGLIELQRISMHFEATAETIMGLSGLGDLIATCSSSQSRNWQFGHMVVTESDASKWYDTNRGQTEGVRTIEKIMPIIVEYSLDLPIMTAVWRLIKQEASPQTIIQELMERGLKSEVSE